jgi:hypothetical protein
MKRVLGTGDWGKGRSEQGAVKGEKFFSAIYSFYYQTGIIKQNIVNLYGSQSRVARFKK